MKTEQFDDEFRKKLLGLDPSDEEVDRIYNYVSSNGNITPRFFVDQNPDLWVGRFILCLLSNL
jgi:hypothetical protein